MADIIKSEYTRIVYVFWAGWHPADMASLLLALQRARQAHVFIMVDFSFRMEWQERVECMLYELARSRWRRHIDAPARMNEDEVRCKYITIDERTLADSIATWAVRHDFSVKAAGSSQTFRATIFNCKFKQ